MLWIIQFSVWFGAVAVAFSWFGTGRKTRALALDDGTQIAQTTQTLQRGGAGLLRRQGGVL